MQYINQGPLFLSVQMHQPDRTAHAYMDALQAFWPGLQVSSFPSIFVSYNVQAVPTVLHCTVTFHNVNFTRISLINQIADII